MAGVESLGVPMSGRIAATSQGMGRKLPTRPAEIRDMLLANADPGVVERFDSEWDDALERCRQHDTAALIFGFLRRWGFEALNWEDPDKHRAHRAHVDDLVRNGPPSVEQRHGRDQVIAAWEERHGRPFVD
jgi:Family of unknown function (DUF6247)